MWNGNVGMKLWNGIGAECGMVMELWNRIGVVVEWEWKCVYVPQVCVSHFWRPFDSQRFLTSSE